MKKTSILCSCYREDYRTGRQNRIIMKNRNRRIEMIIVYFIILLAIVLGVWFAIAALQAVTETGNSEGNKIALLFIGIAIILVFIFLALPPIKPTCTLEGLL